MSDKQLIFIDTNILVYAIYGSDAHKLAVNSILTNSNNTPVLSIQVLKEFSNVSIKKKLMANSSELKKHLTKIKQSFTISDITFDTQAL